MNTKASVIYGWGALTAAGIIAFYIAKADLNARRKAEAEQRLGSKDQDTGNTNVTFDKDLSFYERIERIEENTKKQSDGFIHRTNGTADTIK